MTEYSWIGLSTSLLCLCPCLVLQLHHHKKQIYSSLSVSFNDSFTQPVLLFLLWPTHFVTSVCFFDVLITQAAALSGRSSGSNPFQTGRPLTVLNNSICGTLGLNTAIKNLHRPKKKSKSKAEVMFGSWHINLCELWYKTGYVSELFTAELILFIVV